MCSSRCSAPNYTFAAACWSGGLADWIGVHVDALAFLGGVPKLIVCDNLKAGVTAACRYEPGANRTYQDMAIHYGTSILPARVRRPRGKAPFDRLKVRNRERRAEHRAVHPGAAAQPALLLTITPCRTP